MKTQFTFDLKTILIVVVVFIIFMGGGFGFMGNQIKKTNDKLAEQINLSNALQDELHYTTNYLQEQVATKLTLQTTVDRLEELNDDLSDNQRELVSRIRSLENKNNLISAALVRTEAKLDSAMFEDVDVEVNEKDTTITFAEKTDSISFDIVIGKAMPASPLVDPTIMFRELLIPNKQEISFVFADDKKYHQKPISFSITNSNPLITTTEADSYTIPEVNYKALHPSFGEKVGEFFNKPVVKWVGAGIIFGTGIYVGTQL